MARSRWLVPSMLLIALSVLIWTAIAAAEDGENLVSLEKLDALIDDSDREHWAFRAVKRPPLPEVHRKQWCRNEIDRFVLARLEAKGWSPAPPAKTHHLLRRIFLDLIGLPPTSEEHAAFFRDNSPARTDRLVQRLLSQPGYGERWARHWLDLVRFAETNGYERDATKPHVWRYRDYVIRSLNDDKPFDRFVIEQLAGDEIDTRTAETVIATGFHRLGPWDDEPADPLADRYDQLDDMVSTTAQVFLGLTLGCARCHNHKFEPLTIADYYRMVAIFDPLERPRNGRTDLDAPAGSYADLAAVKQRDAEIAELEQLPDKTAAAERIARLRAAVPDLPRGYFFVEGDNDPPTTHLLLRGSAGNPGPEVTPGFPTVLQNEPAKFLPPSEQTSRRRLSLAKWIASEDHPLTARVIVNRVWQHHFGEALVRTPNDFGLMGQPPTHPELLDWLADWFVREADWSLKKLHAFIMSSNTYRMSQTWNAEYAEKDPQNELLWRMPRRRLEVEAIRDSMLSVSGTLSRKMYGPSMYPYVPPAALTGHSDPEKIWKPFDEQEASRRTVYAFIKRSMVVPMLEVLDLCDTTKSAPQREVTNVAPQALTLFNGHFVQRQSWLFAERLRDEAGESREDQIRLAFRLALCREPSELELAKLQDFLAAEEARLLNGGKGDEKAVQQARHRSLQQMCRVIFNLNEFAFAD